MASAHPVDWSFSPLDEELWLLPQYYTPRLVEQIARLGACCVSFDCAAELLRDMLGVEIEADTVRRITEESGAAAAALERAKAAELERTLARPAVVLADRLQQISVDGVMVPLVGGEWAEVKNLAIGRVEQTGEGPRARDLSYFARLAEAGDFIHEARVECWRRATESAREVVTVNDGAEWITTFIDEHCPQALRIIDWNHAASYVRAAGVALFGANTADCVAWTKVHVDLLWEGHADVVVAELARFEDGSDRLEAVRKARQYLAKRLDQLHYGAFRENGYPIGSGIVESANNVVVEARLKGSGKHWARENVNPMLAHRCAQESGRWADHWLALERSLRRAHRRGPAAVAPPTQLPPAQPIVPLPPPSPPTIIDGRPTDAHPWKRSRSCRAKT